MPNALYTWSFDENTVNDVFLDGDHPTEQQILDLITPAINAWLNAIHGGSSVHNLIEFIYTADYNSANIKVEFSPMADDTRCGTTSGFTVVLNSVGPEVQGNPTAKNWGPTALSSTILHEFGHVFMWQGHVNNQDAIMYADPCTNSGGIITSISQCEKDYVMNLYNPLHNVTVANNFGGYGGGKVKVDAVEHLNIPSEGKVFDTWRKNTFPHSLEALTQQIVEPANGKTYNRLFNRWTNVVSGTNTTDNPNSILPQNTTHRADFRKEFNVTLSSLSYIETSSGGYYTIDGNQGTSTTITELNTKQIQAYPQGSNWVFIDWQDADNITRYGNPLTLAPTDHVVNMQGRYKQHLASNSTAALSSNAQHKILRDVNNIYHAVYESAGKIFYTSSTDAGSTWTNEVLISSGEDVGTYSSKNPSIDLYYHSASGVWYPIVAWEVRESTENSVAIKYIKKTPSGWTGVNGTTVYYELITGDIVPMLAYPYIFYRGNDALYVIRNTSEEYWSDTSSVPGTSSASRNVAAIHNRWTDSKTHLAWEENGSIKYRNMTYASGYTWSSLETVASGYDLVSNLYPSITGSYDNGIWIAWEYKDDEIYQYRIRARKRNDNGTWGAVSSFGSGTPSNHPYYLRPSISGNRKKNNDLSIAWYKSTNETQKVSYVSGAWGSISALSSSNQTPQLAFNETAVTFTNKIGFSRSTSGSVYSLTPISFTEGGGPLEKSSDHIAAQQYTRGVVTSLNDIAYTIQFGNIQLKQPGGEPRLIALATLPDTLPVNTIEEIASYLKSEPFIAYEQSELSLQLQEYLLRGKTAELNGKDVSYKLEFVESKTNNVLYTMHFSHLSERKKTIDVLPYKFGVTGNKEVYIRLSIVPQGDAQPSFTAVNEYSDESENGLNKSGTKGNPVVVDFIPKDFSLGQNYPNPFNPTTAITFDIANDEFVTLSVYDAVGREVEKLVNEHKSPGRYTVQFNASRLSSGLYFYTMTAGKFKATQKMMLVK